MSPQTGLPQNNRVGDFDVFALPAILKSGHRPDARTRLSTPWPTARAWKGSAARAATSATSRPPPRPAMAAPARLALDVYVASAATTWGLPRRAGRGRRDRLHRRDRRELDLDPRGVCRDLGWFGIELDPGSNASGPAERVVSTAGSRVQVWTVPTNEEIVVARQARDLLASLPT